MKNLRFIEIDDAYIDYCRIFDSRVPDNKIETRKHPRKYIGVILEIYANKYFAPLSSYKNKHNGMSDKVDFIKIVDSDQGLAVINLNNMIPVPECVIIDYDINQEQDIKYQSLLRKQLLLCRRKEVKILQNAYKLYEIITVYKTQRFTNRCCDFKLLEEKCRLYQQQFAIKEVAVTKDNDY